MSKKKKQAREKARQAAQAVQFGYKVDIESYCEHSEYSDEQYGPWSESYSNHLKGIVTKTTEYPDVASIHDVKPGTSVLIVWAEWSTGDSFGHATNRSTEVLGLFLDMASAKALADGIKNGSKSAYHSFRTQNKPASDGYDIKTPDGQRFTSGFASWNGYFESLTDVHIDSATVF
jgi:hypothetical protein